MRTTLISWIDYREIMLALLMAIWESFLSVWWGIGIFYRWLVSILDYPLTTAIACLSIYGLAVRLIGIKLFHQAWLINVRRSLKFMPASLIWWWIWTHLLLSLDGPWVYMFLGVILVIMGLGHFVSLPHLDSSLSKLTHHRYASWIWYILLIVFDSLTVIVWWWGIFANYIFKHFYHLGTLEASGLRKISMLGRSLAAITTFVWAWIYDVSLIVWLLILGIPSFVIGTHYVLSKWETWASMLVAYMSIIFGVIMIIKAWY